MSQSYAESYRFPINTILQHFYEKNSTYINHRKHNLLITVLLNVFKKVINEKNSKKKPQTITKNTQKNENGNKL